LILPYQKYFSINIPITYIEYYHPSPKYLLAILGSFVNETKKSARYDLSCTLFFLFKGESPFSILMGRTGEKCLQVLYFFDVVVEEKEHVVIPMVHLIIFTRLPKCSTQFYFLFRNLCYKKIPILTSY